MRAKQNVCVKSQAGRRMNITVRLRHKKSKITCTHIKGVCINLYTPNINIQCRHTHTLRVTLVYISMQGTENSQRIIKGA